jgi:hypothetical protein
MEIINNVAIHHPQNRLKAHVEFSERAKEKTLSYSTIEKTFFSTFIRKDPLFTPMNLRLKIGENPREKQQLVELMNIIAEEIFEGQYDFDLGTDKIEEKIRKGENIPDGHLRATRISREEVVYGWLRYVHNLIKRYYLAWPPESNSREHRCPDTSFRQKIEPLYSTKKAHSQVPILHHLLFCCPVSLK